MTEQLAYVIYVLAGYIVGSHFFFFFVINKLVNKLMSRNYYEYQQKPKDVETKAHVEEPIVEDYIGRVFS